MTNSNAEPAPSRERADAAAVSGAEAIDHPVTEWTLANGIVLSFRIVPPMVLRSASAHIPVPQVPSIWIASRERNEENPSDPDYLRALMQYRADIGEAAMTVGLLMGTAVKHVPDGMYPPEDSHWIDELRTAYEIAGVAGATIHEEPVRARYLDWLRLYAIPTEIDLYTVTQIVTSSVLLTEGEVQRSAASFRRLLVGPTDPAPAVAAPPIVALDGAPDGRGDGSGVRGAGDGEVVRIHVDGVDATPEA